MLTPSAKRQAKRLLCALDLSSSSGIADNSLQCKAHPYQRQECKRGQPHHHAIGRDGHLGLWQGKLVQCAILLDNLEELEPSNSNGAPGTNCSASDLRFVN